MSSWAATTRVVLVGVVVGGIFRYIWKSQLDPARETLLLAMVGAVLTAVYVVLTFEIVLQNQKMTRATFQSAGVMERSLRLSYSPNMTFLTHITKDPTLASLGTTCIAHKNDDYERALREFPGGGQAMEFVFAVVRNVGKGTATKVQLSAEYEIQEQANPNFKYRVTKEATIPLLEAGHALALTIHICRSPSAGDGVKLESASLKCGDFYRDALSEPVQYQAFTSANSAAARAADCTLVVQA